MTRYRRLIALSLLAMLIGAPPALPASAAEPERTPLLGRPYALAERGEVGCPPGLYLVGAKLHYDTAVSGLRPICAGMTDDDLWKGGPQLQADRLLGSPRPNARAGDLLCPRDSFADTISMVAADKGEFSLIVRVAFRCTTRFSSGRGTTWVESRMPEGLGSVLSDMNLCHEDNAATGIFGTTFAGKLIQVGLICRPIQRLMTVAQGLVGIDAPTALMVQPGLKLKTAGDVAGTMEAPPSPFGAPQDDAAAPPAPPQPAPAPLPASQEFAPPLAKSGLPLYACQTVGGESCGGPVADAFCRKLGFAGAAGFDTDTKKVQAETLTGEKCTKKKCKVFERIVCAGAA
jgi:hypothetical protein